MLSFRPNLWDVAWRFEPTKAQMGSEHLTLVPPSRHYQNLLVKGFPVNFTRAANFKLKLVNNWWRLTCKWPLAQNSASQPSVANCYSPCVCLFIRCYGQPAALPSLLFTYSPVQTFSLGNFRKQIYCISTNGLEKLYLRTYCS